MKDQSSIETKGVVGSQIVAIVFIVVGSLTIYDTYSYTDIDSKVFPRTAAILLIVCASLSLFATWLKPLQEEGFGKGSWWRRLLLVGSMLIACMLMPFIGFLYASFVAFGGGLVAAMHMRWSPIKLALYVGSGIALMVGFYTLFTVALNVPLP